MSNSTVTSIAAQNGNQVVVFIMGGTASNETEQVQVSGFSWSNIVSAQVMYATDANEGSGPATITDIATNVVSVDVQNTAQIVINPGGSGRGSAWEIVKLILQ